jgi:hypothetical protein
MYYIMDPKLVELGLMPSLDVGKTVYESQIRNGLQMQLRRVKLGDNIEEAHMRNRQLIAGWAYEMGLEDNVIEKIEKDGKHYYVINDYEALRDIFADQLREIQRIKSEGDYEAGKSLVETYGVKVDRAMHEEVLARVEPLYSATAGRNRTGWRDRRCKNRADEKFCRVDARVRRDFQLPANKQLSSCPVTKRNKFCRFSLLAFGWQYMCRAVCSADDHRLQTAKSTEE